MATLLLLLVSYLSSAAPFLRPGTQTKTCMTFVFVRMLMASGYVCQDATGFDTGFALSGDPATCLALVTYCSWETVGSLGLTVEEACPASCGSCEYGCDTDCGAVTTFCVEVPGKCQGNTWKLQRCDATSPFQDILVQSSAVPSVVDWDGDGDLDLILGATDGVHYFERINDSLVEHVGNQNPFSVVKGQAWPQAVDWDMDGDIDLVVGVGYVNAGSTPIEHRLRYYENLGNNTLVLRGGEQDPFQSLSNASVFHVVDWDGDGDLDIILGRCNCEAVLTSLGVELGCSWTSDEDVPAFILDYYENEHGVLHLASNAQNPFYGINVELFSYPKAVDWDGDGDLDLLVSQFDDSGDGSAIRYFENVAPGVLLDTQGSHNPFEELSFTQYSYTSAIEVVDWDGDGNLDLLVGLSYGNLDYYRRIKDDGFVSSVFPIIDGDFLSTDVVPQIVDWDADGDPELILGDRFGHMRYFEFVDGNRFEEQKAAIWDSQSSNAFFSPVVIDWDGDGDLDIVLGSSEWGIRYFERYAMGNFYDGIQELTNEQNPFSDINIVGFMRVEVVDWDGDGDLDVLVGRAQGIRYFENNPSSTAAFIERTMEQSPFNDIVSNFTHPVPRAIDWDGDGDLDLVVGLSGGTLAYVERRENNTFALNTCNDIFGTTKVVDYENASPVILDWDGDGDLDIIVADLLGYFTYWNQGLCFRDGLCSSKGMCDTYTGFCTCLTGHAPPNCASCLPNYYLEATMPSLPTGRSCVACPGAGTVDGVCWMQGTCSDDAWAQSVAVSQGLSNSSQPLVHGNGSCACISPFFGSDELGHTTCASGECQPGFFISISDSTGFKFCRACDPGRSKPSTGNDAELCVICDSGKHQSQPGSSGCELCSPGSVPSEDKRSCISCDPGTYAVAGQSQCTVCELGKFSNVGSEACSFCEDGFIPTNNQVGCQICGAGFYAKSGNASCTACEASFFAKAGSEHCQSCPAGSMPAQDGGSCTICEAGSYAGEGQSQCSSCQAGRFSNYGSAICSFCDAGYAPNDYRTGCNMCEGGYYARNGDSTCTACEASVFAKAGSDQCLPCSIGFVPNDDRSRCRFDIYLVTLLTACAVVQFLVLYPLFRRLKHRIRIVDVSQSGGAVIVTTFQEHGIFDRVVHFARVHFSGTGHPQLDKPGYCFYVRRLDAYRLEVLNESGLPMTASVDTSMGVMVPCLRGQLLNTGRVIPIAGSSFLLCPVPWLVILFSQRRSSLHLFTIVISAASALAAAVASFRRYRYYHARTPLQSRIKHFSRQLLVANPSPRCCKPGPCRAVSLEQVSDLLCFFRDFINSRTAYYLDANITRVLTKPFQLSYAELVGNQRVTYFVSHYWGTAFAHFVESLRRHADTLTGNNDTRSTAYWICFVSNNQWRLHEEIGESQKSSFYMALHSGFCRGTCMVLDKDALPLTRAWCLFEVLQTFRLLANNDYHFEGLLFCTDRGVIGHDDSQEDTCYDVTLALAKRLTTLRLQDAKASNPEDERMIRCLVEEEGGMDAMNEFVRGNMSKVLNGVQHSFSNQLMELQTCLTPSSSLALTPLDRRQSISSSILSL